MMTRLSMLLVLALVVALVCQTHAFQFSSSQIRSRYSHSLSATYKVKLIDNKNKAEKTIEVADDVFILDAAIEAGMSADYSCQAGLCNTCVAKLESGKVDQSGGGMAQDMQELGWVLICSAYPRSDATLKINEQINMFG